MAETFKRETFFSFVRPMFGNKLTIGQVSGINVKLKLWEDTCPLQDIRCLANILAQNKWETGGKMSPVMEAGYLTKSKREAYLTKMYDIRGSNPTRARKMGNVNPGDGIRFAGAGDIQVTWQTNYLYFEKLLKVPLTANPALMIDPLTSAKVMFIGMFSGHFTGKKVTDYFTNKIDDPAGARAVVNGDKNYPSKHDGYATVGDVIAHDHHVFLSALIKAHS